MHVGWKHGAFHPSYMRRRNFCFVMARHPIKWVNSCMRFNADMWKWWDVKIDEEDGIGLSFPYNDVHISVKRMVDKWNVFYKGWLDHSKCKFIWYADLLNPELRNSILVDIENDNKLIRCRKEWAVPNKVQHSESYTEQKRLIERDLFENNMLNDKPHIVEYINNNIDKDLLNRMMELSYENCNRL